MLEFTATRAQWDEMEGLAYWIADNSYCKERMSREEYEREEYDRHDKSIRMSFDKLDRLNVPFWVQNSVIAWAEDWRRHGRENMNYGLKARNIHAPWEEAQERRKEAEKKYTA